MEVDDLTVVEILPQTSSRLAQTIRPGLVTTLLLNYKNFSRFQHSRPLA